MAPNSCWGIEVGAGALKAIKLERDGDNARVVDYAVIDHAKPLSTPGLDQDDVIRVALGTLVSEKDLSKSSIAVSVPGHSAFARFAKLPPVEPKKVPDIVKFEAVQQIPFPLEEVEWDYQTFQSPDSPDVEVGIFAITKDRIADQLRLFGDVGLTPDAVTLSPVAAYNALAYDLEFTEQTPGTIILDVGATSTDLIVAEAGRVWVRTFPMGGHQFTEKLVDAFKLSYSKAERLKREADQSKHARHIFQALRPAFTDLVQDVQRSIGYYQSLHRDANLTRLIGLGSTFKLPGLRKYLKQQLAIDVYKIEQWKRLELDGPRAGEFQAASLNLATALGCALQGLEFNAIQANLMPVSVVRAAVWRRKTKWFATAAGLAACGAGVMFLRPFLDSTAAAANPKPASIDRAVRAATSEGNRAREAGVVGGATPDFTAANLLNLLEQPDVHAQIVADISRLIADARADGIDLRFVGLSTTYVPPGAALRGQGRTGGGFDGGGFDGGSDERGGGGGGGFDDGGGGADGPAHVTVDLTFDLASDKPLDDFLRSVIPWFQQHAEREGVPYRWLATRGNEQYTFTEAQAPAPDDASGDPRGAGGRDPRGAGGQPPDRDGRDSRGGPGGAGGSNMPDAIDFVRDAPLPEPPARRPAARFTLFVHAALVDPNAPAADDADEENGL